MVKNKIAIAFGCGRESMDMLEMLKDKHPIIITCVVPNGDLDPRMIETFANGLGLKCVIIPSSFYDSFSFEDGIWNYTNSILDYYKEGHPRIFDVLYSGRMKRDYSERMGKRGGKWAETINYKSIPYMKFPFWDRND
jgi:hypothetical protein